MVVVVVVIVDKAMEMCRPNYGKQHQRMPF
jgi:hypothetical protein